MYTSAKKQFMCDSVFKMFALFNSPVCLLHQFPFSCPEFQGCVYGYSLFASFLIFKWVTEFRLCIVEFSVRKYNNSY